MPALTPTNHLLHLHGFRSLPRSKKASAVARPIRAGNPPVTWWRPYWPVTGTFLGLA